MKTIGMLGGMSWESTALYYKALNENIKASLGGLHSAKVCLYSVDFDEIEKRQHNGDWQGTAEILGEAAKAIEAGGADFLLICTNTMHKVEPEISRKISIPVLHIADATANKLKTDNVSCVGLLGTQFTMEEQFYQGRLTDQHNIKVITPNASQRKRVHDVIYTELCLGEVSESSKREYLEIIDELHEQGAQGIILGCTEITMLVSQKDTKVPLYDTTAIHADEATKLALS